MVLKIMLCEVKVSSRNLNFTLVQLITHLSVSGYIIM